MATVEEFLEHHGVKGMKWGVRKRTARVTPAHATHPAPSAKPSEDFLKSRQLKSVGSSAHLTNEQLKLINDRLALEQRYAQLNPKKIDKGHAQVKYVLGFAATAVAAHKLFTSDLGKLAINRGKQFVEAGGAAKAAKAAEKVAPKVVKLAGEHVATA